MEDFKKIFTKMATGYAKYVERKIEAQNQCGNAPEKDGDIYIDSANNEAITLMNEVRTVNVVAVTLNRMNTKENGENAYYSAN